MSQLGVLLHLRATPLEEELTGDLTQVIKRAHQVGVTPRLIVLLQETMTLAATMLAVEQAEEEVEEVLLQEILEDGVALHQVEKAASSVVKKVISQESALILATPAVLEEVDLEAAVELVSNAIRKDIWLANALMPLRMMMVVEAAEVEAVEDR